MVTIVFDHPAEDFPELKIAGEFTNWEEKESRGKRERTKKLKLFEIVLYYLSVCTPYWWNITAKFLSHFHIVPLKRNFVSIFNPLHCGGKILPLRRFL